MKGRPEKGRSDEKEIIYANIDIKKKIVGRMNNEL
jgi:hypothetical protein